MSNPAKHNDFTDFFYQISIKTSYRHHYLENVLWWTKMNARSRISGEKLVRNVSVFSFLSLLQNLDFGYNLFWFCGIAGFDKSLAICPQKITAKLSNLLCSVQLVLPLPLVLWYVVIWPVFAVRVISKDITGSEGVFHVYLFIIKLFKMMYSLIN